WQDVPQQDRAARRVDAARGLDIGGLFEGQCAAAYQPYKGRHAEYRNRDNDVLDAGSKDGDDSDCQQDTGEGEQQIRQAHDEYVRQPPVIARDQAEKYAAHATDQHRSEADAQRDARTPKYAAEDVAAKLVGAGEMGPGRSLQHIV